MNAQTHYSKSSVLILSAVVTAVIAIVVLGGGKWFKKVIFWESHLDESVYGLAIGGPTKYGGMQVGRVEAIDVVGDEYGSGPSKDDLGKRGRSEVDAPTITIVVKPGEGHSVSLGGMGVVFKVPGTATGGAFAVVEHPIEPGRLVPPPVHLREDEYSYVLEGTIGARVGDKEVMVGPGSYVIKPRGVMHTFWNAGPGPGPGGNRPGGFREVLCRARRGQRTQPAGAGSEVRGDLLRRLGRRPDLQVQSEVTWSMRAVIHRLLHREACP